MGQVWSYVAGETRSIVCSTSLKSQKPLLILDINKLLVFRAYAPKLKEEFPECVSLVKDATMLGNNWTWLRPDMEEFLDFIFTRFTVAVWSSAWSKNVDLLCDFIFGIRRSELLFEWDQTKCTKISPHPDPKEVTKPLFAKDLQRVWKEYPDYHAGNTLILDDCPYKMHLNDNLCVMLTKPWLPHKANNETLPMLRASILYYTWLWPKQPQPPPPKMRVLWSW